MPKMRYRKIGANKQLFKHKWQIDKHIGTKKQRLAKHKDKAET